ncbi:Family with sequence similarity 193, member A [Nesidiocoris tenuis]|uniref:Family with sequence similarity 193, member A n=1 Tax=Nesidiocoris tenuis TaxID=355587 RepID=A0ABN7AU21_9HEMI|nr:Family with sequence similarity 193, member A [Nesidiocoris tenuis]
MGKNYKETRERLRRLLHKKKVKRRANPPAQVSSGDSKPDKPCNPAQPPAAAAAAAAVAAPAQTVKPTAPHAPPAKQAPSLVRADKNPKDKKTVEGKNEKQALQDLIDFIEGSEGQCRNEKKAAKRIRQKEKKQMILLQIQREEEERIRQAEEERIRKEREAAMLENLRKAALKKKKKKKNNENSNHFATGPHSHHHQMMMQQQLHQQQQMQQQQYNHHQSKANSNAFGFSNPINNSNPASPIVTIKKIMENDSEPTVTITLRGATPKQDKVLYTLLNGKVCEPGKNSKGSKNFKDLKMNKETERPQFLSKKGAAPQKPLLTSLPVEQKPFRPNPVTNYHAPSNPSPQSTRELTNPTSIQINNAVSSMTRNGFHDFNFPGIRLPPEITITKVDPTKAKFKTPQRGQESHQDQISLKPIPKPVKKAPTPEVIYVSTNKLKQEADLAVTRSIKPDLPDKVPASGASLKKRRKKKETEATSKQKMSTAYPGLDIEIVKTGEEQTSNLCQQMSFLTINPYTDNQVVNDVDQPAKTAKKRRKKKKKANKAEGGGEAEDWNTLDNVFVPKHLDLNDGEIDDAERELEAFKLFCMQSVPVPLDRKEKVNLNLKDLVLKKKSVSCS